MYAGMYLESKTLPLPLIPFKIGATYTAPIRDTISITLPSGTDIVSLGFKNFVCRSCADAFTAVKKSSENTKALTRFFVML
jgi:hypothetical protein